VKWCNILSTTCRSSLKRAPVSLHAEPPLGEVLIVSKGLCRSSLAGAPFAQSRVGSDVVLCAGWPRLTTSRFTRLCPFLFAAVVALILLPLEYRAWKGLCTINIVVKHTSISNIAVRLVLLVLCCSASSITSTTSATSSASTTSTELYLVLILTCT
jgi:hypothetical protein